MPGIETLTLGMVVALVVIMLLAGVIHGTLGLGFPLMATPLLALMTDVRSAVLITLLPTMAVNLLSIWRGGRWRASLGRFWPLALFVALGSIIGTRWLIVTDPAPFKLVLAGAILAYLYVSQRGGQPLAWLHFYPRISYPLVGLCAGILAGMVNVMVPVLIMFTLELQLAPLVMVQFFNLCFLSGKLAQAGTFLAVGQVGWEALWYTAPLAVVALIALRFGMGIRERVDQAVYRDWVRKALGVMALLLVGQFALG